MEKKILVISWVVIILLIYTIAQANYEIMLRADPIKFIGEPDPIQMKDSPTHYSEVKRLYTDYSFSEMLKAILKSLGYSLATILIILYHQKIWVKLLFVVLDSVIIFIYLHSGFWAWYHYGSYIYAIYTGIIMFFVGIMATEFLKDSKSLKLK